MFNPFLVLRTAFFALFLMFGLLLLALTAWNISSAAAVGVHAPGSSIFLLFTNCLMIILVVIAKIEYFKPHVRTASVLVECGWVAIIALFQLGGAISSTTGGSLLSCQINNLWSTCASSSIVVPVSWLNCLIAFAYFFVLFASVMSHVRTYPDVWRRTIYTVDWFVDPRMKAFLHEATSQPRMVSWSEYLEGIKSTAERKQLHALQEEPDVEKAPWAESISVRRGKDNPYAASMSLSRSGRSTTFSFATKTHQTKPSVSSSCELSLPYVGSSGHETAATENAVSPPLPPLPPPKSLSMAGSESSFGTKFVERLTQDLRRSSHPVLPRIKTTSLFPSTIRDHDLPIPLPHKSEWVRVR